MMKMMMPTLKILVFIILILNERYYVSGKSESRVVCYYTNWSAYRQGPAKFLPDNINPYLCTHLIYAFGGLTSESGIKPFDKYQDIDKGGYTKFNGLKTYNKALKTLIAIGGWNEGSGRFSRLVSDSESRKSFIKNTIRFLRQHHFDGLDLDWEYPAAREGGEPQDKKNYAIFIKEIREAFEDESRNSGRTRLLLTIAVPAGIEWIQKGFDVPTINRNVDFFNLLTYDFHASTEPAANHHAPLKPKDGFSDYDYKSQLNIEYAINYYLEEGADADKLVVGLPTYGRSYTLFNPDSTDIGAPASGPGTKGKYTKEPGYLAYYEICEGIKSGEWHVENDQSETQGPHAVKDDQWVGYDDKRIMAIKAKWVRDNKLGGIMFWSIDNDDFRGYCDGKPFPLIEAAKIAYYTGEAPEKIKHRNPSNRFSNPSRRTSTTTTTPIPPSTTTNSYSSKRKTGKKTTTVRPRRRRIKPKSTTSTTTPTPPVTSDPLRTPPPPTTPETSVDFECKDDGFFPHPRDCKKYFWCLDAPGLGIVAHHFTCPAGLFFNKNTDSCDYARNVPCKPGGAATTTTTTTTQAPTTTTTAKPEEEYEYYDDDDEVEEEEDISPLQKAVKKTEKKTAASGKSAQEIKDIRNLLGIIKKLGGVEELEKYLEANPDIAEEVEEYEDGEEEEEEEQEESKPSTSKPSIFASRNRFNPTTVKKTNTRTYTSIQRDRNKKQEEEDNSKEQTSSSTTTPSKSFRPKYVTLSRDKNNVNSGFTSSTQTSIVVRYSNEEKLLEDTTTSKPVTYVTSRPYSKVTGTLENESEGISSENRDKPKYVTLARGKTTAIPNNEASKKASKEENSESQIAEEDYPNDEFYEDEEYEILAPVTTSTSTTSKPLTSQRLRIPTRNRPAISRKTTSTTTTTTTTEAPPPPSKAVVTYRPSFSFTPTIRRNTLFDRRKFTTTTTVSTPVEAAESISRPIPSRRIRPYVTSTTTTTSTPDTGTRFRPRFRGSTISTNEVSDNFLPEKSRGSTTLSPLPSAFQSAVIRRRTRKPTPKTTTTPLTTTTTTTTSTTTAKPLPQVNSLTPSPKIHKIVPIADSQDYYYYVYEDEDDPLEKSQSQSAPSSTFLRRSLDLSSPTLSNSRPLLNSIVPLSQKIQIKGNGAIECKDRGIYPHPTSCGRSYIRCVENENGIGIKAWEFICPKSLTFDPIGGMCNWATNQDEDNKSNSNTPCPNNSDYGFRK